LLAAVNLRDIKRAEILLRDKAHVDVNWRSKKNVTGPALLYAAAYGPPEMVDLLLRNGADPNLPGVENRTPLLSAAFEGNDDIVRKLLAAGAKPDVSEDRFGRTALMEAARKGHESTVLLLLQGGANPLAVDKAGYTADELVNEQEHAGLSKIISERAR
jgi:ankyrin repeat protein